ncbi:MAG: hypothetical protein U5L96_13880 [Owenweeksia sp.]|nr:hypothetical protein [Owenweeksia sp.]
MKRICLFVIAVAMSSSQAVAQDSLRYIRPYPKEQFQVSMVLSDFAVNRVRLEGSYRIRRQHAIGFGIADVYGRESYSTGQDQFIDGFYLNGSHKYYLKSSAGSNSQKVSFLFMRSSLNFQQTSMKYEEEQWRSYLENGNTIYELIDVTSRQVLQRLGLDFEMGIEFTRELWFFEVSMGMGYRIVIKNKDDPSRVWSIPPYFLTAHITGYYPPLIAG